MKAAYIHPTALIEDGVDIGHDSSVWDSVHVLGNTRIGRHCIVGEKTHISHGVHIGDFVKIDAFVYICTAVTLEDGVMICAGCVFTNDRYPRATEPELMSLRPDAPDEQRLSTRVRAGASIGARSIIGCNLSIGRFAMVGMGSLVTHPIDDFHLVIGSPARVVGYVCRCGQPFAKFEPGHHPERIVYSCAVCRRRYTTRNGVVSESFAAIK
jgi:UDP-2-acetamido-3-amino-2,3-dideoxy-glucuronate N-acetyltransferase